MNLPGHETALLCLSVDDTLSSLFARWLVNAEAGTIAENVTYTCIHFLSAETTRQTARLLCVGWDGDCCDGASEAPNALNLPYLARRSHYVTYLELGCSLVTVIAPAFFGLYDLIGVATPSCLHTICVSALHLSESSYRMMFTQLSIQVCLTLLWAVPSLTR